MEGFKLLRVKKQQFGRICGKREFLDLEHFGKAARQNFSPFKFTHFPPFKWFFQCVLFNLLDIKFGWRGAQVDFFVSYFRSRSYNSAQASTLGEEFSRFRPVDPPTNDTRRYGAKEAYPRLGSLAARQTFFQAVDRLPHPRVRGLASYYT